MKYKEHILKILKIVYTFFRWLFAILGGLVAILWQLLFTLLRIVGGWLWKGIDIIPSSYTKGGLRAVVLLGFSGVFVVFGLGILFYAFTPLPDIDTFDKVSQRESIILTDRNGEFLFDFSESERRNYVPHEEISPTIIKTIIAAEDKNFFNHGGIYFPSFIRALISNVQTRSFGQGGSTITQQVIKNTLLTGEKKIQRKVKEFILAPKLERALSKELIIERYLNTISYGGVVYGVGGATKSFYDKKPTEVTLAEAAYLAAIPNAPTRLSPYGSNLQELEQRKNSVLFTLLEEGDITREEYEIARNEKVFFQPQNVFSIKAPHFVFFVKRLLEEQYGNNLSEIEGSVITSSLDIELQEQIEEYMRMFAPGIEEKHGAKNLASVVLSVKTGDVLAMVGSLDFFNSEIDGNVNITTSLRQPGSTFKPFVYAKAFEKGLTPDTVVIDAETQFTFSCEIDRFESTEDGCYSPVNYDGQFRGPITLRDALAQSINVPAVKTLYIAGVDKVVDMVQSFGVTSLTENPFFYGLSLVLGGGEISPLELASAYSVFADRGNYKPYKVILDEDVKSKKVLPENIANTVNDVLSDNSARAPVFGRNSPLAFPSFSVAAKTGTTNNSRDIWVVGYSSDVVVVVWGGNAKGELLSNKAAGFSLSPLFRDIMIAAQEKYGVKNSLFSAAQQSFVDFEGEPWVDREDDEPHSILHFINKNNIRSSSNSQNDSQYEHWEYAVKRWFEGDEEEEISPGIITPPTNTLIPNTNSGDATIQAPGSNRQQNNTFQLSIISPTTNTFDLEEKQTVIVNKPNFPTSYYEFYINSTLIGSTPSPLISFTPSEVLQKRDEVVTIRAVLYSTRGVFVTEKTYNQPTLTTPPETETPILTKPPKTDPVSKINQNTPTAPLSNPIPIPIINRPTITVPTTIPTPITRPGF